MYSPNDHHNDFIMTHALRTLVFYRSSIQSFYLSIYMYIYIPHPWGGESQSQEIIKPVTMTQSAQTTIHPYQKLRSKRLSHSKMK